MRIFFLILYFLITVWSISFAQEMKFPLERKNGKLLSQWTINNTIEAEVFLETGFPKIVISENFAKKHLYHLVKMTEAPVNTYIALWDSPNQRYKVSYHINDTLIVNGEKLKIDALVTDFAARKSWENCDIIFPLFDLSSKIELNIKENYMKINHESEFLSTGIIVYEAKRDNRTKGLYITTTLKIFDTYNKSEELSGNFLFDLGAGNTFFLNKNLSEVSTFVAQSDRMQLKDTTRFQPNHKAELSIIIPDRIIFDKIEIKETFIAAMKLFASNSSNKYVGVIGTSFFTHFIVIFDFDNNKLYLKPNSDNVKIFE